jgi:hypothetical protein
MAAAHPLAPPANEQANGPRTAAAPGVALEQALVPSPHPPKEGEGIALTAPVGRLPVELDVSIPVRNFRVRNLLALELSQLIESGWGMERTFRWPRATSNWPGANSKWSIPKWRYA